MIFLINTSIQGLLSIFFFFYRKTFSEISKTAGTETITELYRVLSNTYINVKIIKNVR